MEQIPVQLGSAVYALCEDHFSQAIDEVIPDLSGDLADPSVIELLADGSPRCDWCEAERRGKSFLGTVRAQNSFRAPEPDSLLGT